MRCLFVAFALAVGRPPDEPTDRWFAPDKVKHFFTAALVQSLSFSALRATRLSKRASLAGATAVSLAVSVGKELYDKEFGGDPSLKDLTWDAAGILAASVLLQHTEVGTADSCQPVSCRQSRQPSAKPSAYQLSIKPSAENR